MQLASRAEGAERSPREAPGLPRAGCPQGQPWTAASSSPAPAVHCRTAGAEPPPRHTAGQHFPALAAGAHLAGVCVGSSRLSPKLVHKQP